MVNNASGNYANSVNSNYWTTLKGGKDSSIQGDPIPNTTTGGDSWQSQSQSQSQEPGQKSNSFLKGLFVKGPVDMVKSLFTLKGAGMAIGGLIACLAFPYAVPLALSALALGAGGYQMFKGFSKGDKTQAGVGAFTALTGLAGGFFGCKKPTYCDEMPVYHDEHGMPLLDYEGVPLGREHVYRDPHTGGNDFYNGRLRNGKHVYAPVNRVFKYKLPESTGERGQVYPEQWFTRAEVNSETGEWATLEELQAKYPHRSYLPVTHGRFTEIFQGKDGQALVDPFGCPISERFVYQHPVTKQNEVFTDAEGNPIYREFLKVDKTTGKVEQDRLKPVPKAERLNPGTPMGDSFAEYFNIQPKQNLQNAYETLRQGENGDTSASARLQPFKKPFTIVPGTLSTSYGYKNQEEQAS